MKNDTNSRTDSTMTTFNARQRKRFGTWNIQTLSEPTRLYQVLDEMKNYKLEFLGLSEMRWLGQGEVHTAEGHLLLYSGRNRDQSRMNGVGIVLSKQIKKSLMEWKAISDRIIYVRLRSKFRNISLLQCYAPTEPSNIEIKEAFYAELSDALNEVKVSDMILLMGDFNSKVGIDNTNIESVMGRQGIGTKNTNGDLLIDLCQRFNLTIGGTLFPHKDIHKTTWRSPNNITNNQIDHIIISRKWKKSLLDVRNKRGADVGSDHHLLIGDIMLKITPNRSKIPYNSNKRYNLRKLEIKNVRNKFQETIISTLDSLNSDSPGNQTSQWNTLKNTIHHASETVLGIKEKHKKRIWISNETMLLIGQRKEAKSKLNMAKTSEDRNIKAREYNTINRLVKRSARTDKRKWADDIANEAERAAQQNNSRLLYRLTKLLSNQQTAQNRPLKDKNGQIISNVDDQLNRWEEYFKEVLGSNTNNQQTLLPAENVHTQLNICTDPPTIGEVKHAIKNLKDGKAPGPDNIPPEILKASISVLAPKLTKLIKLVWTTETIPSSWKEGLIVKLPKRGDLTICKNWRGITLLNLINKLLAHIVQTRIGEILEPKLRREQAGFRPQRSCIDNINTLRIIIEQSAEWQSPLYALFIDFRRAFDSLKHKALWDILHERGIPAKLIRIIKELYNEATCRVLHQGKVTNSIPIMSGVKQGCPLSPLLFNIAIDWLLKTEKSDQRGIVWDLDSRLDDIDYADDICLLSHTFVDIQEKANSIAEKAKLIGLEINIGKTKLMRINNTCNDQLSIGEARIEDVSEFCYLGSMLTKDGGASSDIEHRIQKARQAFGLLNNIWRSLYITTRTKLRIFNTNVKSVLLYGCETWKMTSVLATKLQVFVNKCLRRILRIKWTDMVTNKELRERADQIPIIMEVKRRKWNWIGHVLRREPTNIARRSLEWNPQGKRKPGRPRTTWRRTVMDEARSVKKVWPEIKYLAANRVRWRQFVADLCSTQE